MRRFVTIEKKVGETPLQALEHFRAGHPDMAGVPLTYAGRLDPMAHGKLLVLIGDECKRRARYDTLDKEYEFAILFGFESDTGDILGLSEVGGDISHAAESRLRELAHEYVGTHTFAYPAYSSKTVGGKPLFQYAREGTLDDVEIPKNTVRVYNMRFVRTYNLKSEQLLQYVQEKIGKLVPAPGNDFRETEILARWRTLLEGGKNEYPVAVFRVTVSAGTYIRALAPHMAERLGASGLALSIHRTNIGRFLSFGGIGMWLRKY